MTSTVIYIAFKCHICITPPREYNECTDLRRHLRKEHKVEWTGQPGKRRSKEKGVTHFTKSDLENYSDYITWFMCGACDHHYLVMDNLRAHIDQTHSVIVVPGEQPLDNLTETKLAQPNATKKRKLEDDITQSIFQCTTPQESAMTKTMLDAFNVRSVSMNMHSEGKSAVVSISTSEQDLKTIASFSDSPVTINLELGERAPNTQAAPSPSMGDDYVHCCLQRLYPGLLKHQTYQEVDDSCLDMLNEDWKRKPFLRVACGKLLAGSILVEGNHALLINCIELYNHHPAIDPHYERFGSRYMISTIPSFSNRYKNKLSIKSKNEDRSKKLIIGTNVFNGLVTSSVRLDTALDPEVGASTFLFNPSTATKMYISSASIEQANESILQQACFANTFDYDSQLRQVRSRLTSPKTYLSSRFSSRWTDKLSCRPHTIFTLSDRNQVDADSDYMVASNVLKEAADCMRFDKGLLQKSALSAITTNDKETKSKIILKSMMNLYTDQESLNIIGNAKVEKLLVELAEVCTGQLKKTNEGIKSMVMDCLMEMEKEWLC